jgi:chorismate synthase
VPQWLLVLYGLRMSALRYLTAGESHGAQLTAIVDGCPSGLELPRAFIDAQLRRRQGGYGRGSRQSIERDVVDIVGGVRLGFTTGAPVALVIRNKDAANWTGVMDVDPVDPVPEPVTVPRPGHADLVGALTYGRGDIRDVLERASARETAARVAAGAVARRLLQEVGCEVWSHVVAIGAATVPATVSAANGGTAASEFRAAAEADPVRCADPGVSEQMREQIDQARERGDTVGGVFEVVAEGVPAGLGSYVQHDLRLDGALAAAVMSIPAIKGVEIGIGFAAAALPGSQVHDVIVYGDDRGWSRETNRAGGTEGGMSTGRPVVVRAAMKPIATLMDPLPSTELGTHAAVKAHVERSDVCAVPAAAVVAEAAVCLCVADALLRRFGGARVTDVVQAVRNAAARERGV